MVTNTACAKSATKSSRSSKTVAYTHTSGQSDTRHGDPMAKRRDNTERIHDLLSIDGGWWAPENIADRLEINRDTVGRSLKRKSNELFESRPHPNDPNKQKKQWRAIRSA